MEQKLGFPCHKYIMRNMDCANEKQVAEFAKSYYVLKKETMDDVAILAELFALGEYSKLPGKHTSPDFLHRGNITYKETSYFSSLEKDSSIKCYACEEFAQRHLNKLHVCQVCAHKHENFAEMELLYEKVLRSIMTDANLHLQFEIACKKANVDVNEFFVIPYDLGDVFTTRSPHIVPIMQMIYDYYYENATSLFMMLAMDESAPKEICKIALKGVSKICTLSPMITDIPSYKDIIVETYYERIFLSDDKFNISQLEQILPSMLLFSKAFIQCKKETEMALLKQKEEKKAKRKKRSNKVDVSSDEKIKNKESSVQADANIVSGTSDTVSTNTILAVSEETKQIYQEISFDFLLEDEPFEDVSDEDVNVLEQGPKDSFNLQNTENEISEPKESSKTELACVNEMVETIGNAVFGGAPIVGVSNNCYTAAPCLSYQTEVLPMPVVLQFPVLEQYDLDKKYRFRKGNPIFCEVVYSDEEQKEYIIFGNMASRYSSMCYVSQEDNFEIIYSLFGDPRYQFVTYNGYTFIRFLKERGIVPKKYTCLSDMYFYIMHKHSSIKNELMELSEQSFVEDMLNVLSLYKIVYQRCLTYFKSRDKLTDFSFYEERCHTLNLSHASYMCLMNTCRDNKNYICCDDVSAEEIYFTKYIPKPFSGNGYYYLFSVSGLSSQKKVSEFEEKILSLLYYKKYMISYQVVLLYVKDGEFIFYCSEQDGPNFVSHMEVEMLETGRELSAKIVLEQKAIIL